MKKLDDRIEELERFKIKEEIAKEVSKEAEEKIQDGIRKGLTRWAHTICMTATSAVITGMYTLGQFIYDKWHPLQAAIEAFIRANKP